MSITRPILANTRDFSGTASATATLIIPQNQTRRYVAIVNTSANRISVGLGIPPSTVGAGIALSAGGGSFEIDRNNPFFGDIYILGTAAAETFSALEISG